MYIGTQVLIGMEVLCRAVSQIVHIHHIAVIHQVTHIVEEVLMCLGCYAQDRMVFPIVSFYVFEQAIIVLAEVLVAVGYFVSLNRLLPQSRSLLPKTAAR